jgi:flavin reductase (DIM6/NTAB) family NADH-FMN oxidoreductase RutF
MTTPEDLRRAFGRFMTGVTVVTTRDATGQPFGFTANSFTSVSLDPPLLLVCPGKFLSSYAQFATCTHFAVNVLAEGQEDISNTFASFTGDRFAKVPHGQDENGIPLIRGALARFSCATHQVVEAGDHCILIGKVLHASQREGAGLGYADGQYFSLGLERQTVAARGQKAICGAIIEVGDQVLMEHSATGYRPPQVERTDRARFRQALKDSLAARGVEARLGAAYSVFEDDHTHWTYVLGTAQSLPATGGPFVAVDVSALHELDYTSDAVASMMTRYAAEARNRDFSLYLGGVQRGEIHNPKDRS